MSWKSMSGMFTANHSAIGLRSNSLQAAQAELGHPPRLALPPGDLLDDALVDALLGREGVLDLVAPAELVLREVEVERRHGSHASLISVPAVTRA